MTPKRRAILDFIRTRIAEDGCAPTLREIGEEFGIGHVCAHEHVNDLIREGALVRTPHVARGLSLPDEPKAIAAKRLEELALGFKDNWVGPELLEIRRLLVGGKAGT